MSRPVAPADPAAQGPSRRTIRRLGAVAIGLVAMTVGVMLSLAPPDGLPLDPASPEGDGLLGVVELLGELGVDVEVSDRTPRDTSARVFVPVDQMSGDARAELVAFAEEGGTVVVAGESPGIHGLSPLDGSPVDVLGRTSRPADCDALGPVGEVLQRRWTPLEVPEEAVACFPVGEFGAWLVAVPTGSGTIVALGSAQPFTNAQLGEADNAVLAAALLGPRPGDRLRIVPRGEVGEGDTALTDLIPAGVVRAASLLLVAVVVAVLWRARRLGPPVAERLPPVLPSAELARSVADLLQRAGDRAAAAGRIRDDVRTEVRHALRLPAATPSPRLVELASQRSGVEEADARSVLIDTPVERDRDLTELAAAASRVRVGLRRPAPATTAGSDLDAGDRTTDPPTGA